MELGVGHGGATAAAGTGAGAGAEREKKKRKPWMDVVPLFWGVLRGAIVIGIFSLALWMRNPFTSLNFAPFSGFLFCNSDLFGRLRSFEVHIVRDPNGGYGTVFSPGDEFRPTTLSSEMSSIPRRNLLQYLSSAPEKNAISGEFSVEIVTEPPETTCLKYMTPTSWNQSVPLSSDESEIRRMMSKKYIYVASLYEQLSKAKRHLTEVVYLAKKYKRILILPRVGKSRINSSQALPFCTYFDEKLLGHYIHWITEDYYMEIMKTMNHNPSTHLYCMNKEGKQPSYCLRRNPNLNKILEISNYRSQNLSYTIADDQGFISERMVQLFSNFTAFKKKELVLYAKFLASSSIRPLGLASKYVRYSPLLEQRAQYVIQRHLNSKYIAIHLRFEYLAWFRPKFSARINFRHRMNLCTDHLISLVRNLSVEYDTENVYVASDLYVPPPIQGSALNSSLLPLNTTAMSDTWGLRKDEQFGISAEKFLQIRENLKVCTLLELQPSFRSFDSGVLAILDKLICAKAHVFVAGTRDCGGGGNYHEEILMLRREFENHDNYAFRK